MYVCTLLGSGGIYYISLPACVLLVWLNSELRVVPISWVFVESLNCVAYVYIVDTICVIINESFNFIWSHNNGLIVEILPCILWTTM